MTDETTKPAVLPVSTDAPEPDTTYRKLSIGAKRTHAAQLQREPAIVCPRCATGVMPAEMLAHMVERCPGELPLPHPLSRWVKRDRALYFAPNSVLAHWTELDLLRTRGDGEVLERDAALLCAWSRALGVL